MSEAPFAVLGIFSSAQALTDAVPKVQAAGFKNLEAYTPYPIHHLDEVLGMKPSPLPRMVLAMGLLGACSALGFEYWASALDYPLVVGGKAFFSWQAFVPVMFEVTVLFATYTAGLAMLFVLNKLPFFGHPVLAAKAIAGITRDKFALSIEALNGALDLEGAKAALTAAGADELEVVNAFGPAPAPAEHGAMRVATAVASMGSAGLDGHGAVAEADDAGLSSRGVFRIVAMIAIACAFAGTATWAAVKLVLTLPPITHIQNQPKLNAQRASSFFADGRGMRLPVAGTVARGNLPYLFKVPEEAGAALSNPLPRSAPVLEKGRKAYTDHCSVCHGTLGNGETTLSSAYGAKPANLQAALIREYPDGRLYHVIMTGKNAMPSYAADLQEDERWAIVHYLRALQRSQNARDEDVR